MKIIEKIEIKHFRSYKETVKIINLKDLNIFSGSNDVGKSNILKVLNLFFNNSLNNIDKFDLSRDLSFLWEKESNEKIEKRKSQRKQEGSYASQRSLFVSVKIHFLRHVSKDSTTPEKFWVEKRWDKNGLVGEYNTNVITVYRRKNKDKQISPLQENAQKGLVKRFLNSISFEYIPAVKDRNFFKFLFKKLQNSLLDRDKSFQEFSKRINENISKTTSDLFVEFKSKTGISAEFSIPETLVDFFNTINVSTENGVSLYARGDGIQARFIPAILNEISRSKAYVLWGFEEPENSYEYRASDKLAKDFLREYSKDKQIFVTSHTKEFLSLVKGNEEKVSLYRVYQTLENNSLIEEFKKKKGFDKQKILYGVLGDKKEQNLLKKEKDVLVKIFEDIGFLETDQYLIENLENQLREQRIILDKSSLTMKEKEKIISALNKKIERVILDNDNLKKEIEEFRKPILYIEDKYSQIYKIAYLKLNEYECNQENFDQIFSQRSFFLVKSGNSAGGVAGLLRTNDPSLYEEKIIIGLFDFDKEGRENFHCLSKDNFWKEHTEGSLKEKIYGNKRTGLYKKRTDHPKFFAMLLPIPEELDFAANISWRHNISYVEVENLLPSSFLKEKGLVTPIDEPVGKILKIKENKKKNLWKMLFDLPKENFSNFLPLFSIIRKLANGDCKES